MSEPQTITMTQQGYDALVAELNDLKEVKSPAAIARLALARSYGDLSENAEYHSAKEDLAMLEGRISELEYLVAQAQVITTAPTNGHVSVGSQVLVELKGKDGSHVFHIVGEWEADPSQKKISEKSPLGQALVGKKAGDSVTVDIPAGKVIYKIKSVK
jgi:transcription elongation factor GreA